MLPTSISISTNANSNANSNANDSTTTSNDTLGNESLKTDSTKNDNHTQTMTMAEIASQKRNHYRYHATGSSRKSRRVCGSQKVNTSRLRRVREIFWDGDSSCAADDHHHQIERLYGPKNRKRRRTTSTAAGDAIGCTVDFNFGPRLLLNKVHDSPHVYTIENFLTDAEMAYIEEKVHLAERKNLFSDSFVDGRDGNLRRRTKKAAINRPTTSSPPSPPQRTSTFIHFPRLSSSRIASIENRAANLLSLPHTSIEPLQLVRYTEGQYFQDHHDLGELYEDGSVECPARGVLESPRRIVTLLVYLNELPPGCGGTTRFPLLTRCADGGEFEVSPKRGMALIWCNIRRDGMPDERLVHSGQVIRSVPTVAPGGRVDPRRDEKIDHDGISGGNICTTSSIDENFNNGSRDGDDDGAATGISSQRLPLRSDNSAVSSPVVKYALNIWACEELR